MEIVIVSHGKKQKQTKFEDLIPGTVFEFDGGIIAIKGEENTCFLLTYSTGDRWFDAEDGTINENYGIAKVHGMLVGVKVDPTKRCTE